MSEKGQGQNTLDKWQSDSVLEIDPSIDQYEGAFLLSAVGDALGWPTEFLEPGQAHAAISLPVRDYVKWEKRIGGIWWGYLDDIERGQYSDDTQLSLAIARCINESGKFEPERFAYFELPLWLHYERGGGRSVKAAARSLIQGHAEWKSNFFKTHSLDYWSTGANGAAMRNLPIALASASDEKRLIQESARNAIITHGHPRAVLGAVLFALAIRHALSSLGGDEEKMLQYLHQSLRSTWNAISTDQVLTDWSDRYKKTGSPASKESYASIFQRTVAETESYLNSMSMLGKQSAKEYYSKIGALDPASKGSGIATVCAAIFHFLKNDDTPEEAIFNAVNLIGSDTDTISSFLGALLGAHFGHRKIYADLQKELQDASYITKTADRTFEIAWSGADQLPKHETNFALTRKEAYVNILAWEIGLHEMFWDAIDEGGIVVHPTLGRGRITKKRAAAIRREGYVGKLVNVEFDSGQSCTFHSRVKDKYGVAESLTHDIDRALDSTSID